MAAAGIAHAFQFPGARCDALMATLVLGGVGRVVGGLIGGPIGAAIGGAIGAVGGSIIDQTLFARTEGAGVNKGPRLRPPT